MSIEVLDESGRSVDVKRLGSLSRFVLERMRVHPLAELCVKLVDVDTITELNAKWMEGNGPTDVLAFDRGTHVRCMVNLGAGLLPLGDGELLLRSDGLLDRQLPPDTAAWLRPG